jgi:hypothetical protein
MESSPNRDSFLSHELFKDAALHFDVEKICPSMIITTEEDRKYLDSLSELQREVVLADRFEQLKKEK